MSKWTMQRLEQKKREAEVVNDTGKGDEHMSDDADVDVDAYG